MKSHKHNVWEGSFELPRRLELCALVTEFIVLYALGTPSSLGRYRHLIAIKPECLLELPVERQMVGRMDLTLSVRHNEFEVAIFLEM